ncbi:hypothetical protein DFJ58DRAFT_784424 [Suillus subalutaceus]|uniref:uncharacterized protein n=1 Tax=Suillus subalutaceus TaxID=48586 RepID=UPI001B861AB9|nr:uncharacterized protein DFJ58DRAFT_784424 [Suillus subalutaceus]KAG1856687.1 hypothetical protein DFJ58DRAFT_784424 [Suillus subalutaceus]
MSLQPFISLYRYALEPIAPFSWFGIKVCSIELVAALRLCTILRQTREDLYAKYQRRAGDKQSVEERSFLRDACTSLTIKFGGEAVIGSLLGVPPSFMLSGVSPGVYIAAQAIVEYIPVIPSMSLGTELPLSIVDGFTRALLLCSLIPKPVITHASPVIASSPWTLLLSSLVIANGGFFMTSMFSFLEPTPLTLTTPAAIKPYGWTTTDIWCAPFITGLYALLTQAQPFWAELHSVISTVLGNAGDKVGPMDPEAARALCALILAGMFSTRTAKNYGLIWKKGVADKIKIQ